MLPDHEMMIGRQRVLAADRFDSVPAASAGMHGAQRLARSRPRPFTFDRKNATFTRPSSSAGKSVELDAVAEIPDVDRKSIGHERRGAAAGIEPVQLLRLDLERQPVDLEQLRRPRARREDQSIGLVTPARGAHIDGAGRRDVPTFDALIEMQARAVVDGEVEMRANRFFGKDHAGFVLEQRDDLAAAA